MTSSPQTVHVTREGPVTTVTVDRPDRRNAIDARAQPSPLFSREISPCAYLASAAAERQET